MKFLYIIYVSCLLLLSPLGWYEIASANPICPSVAVIEGDPAVVEVVRENLSMNGVADQPVGGCPFASVRLAIAGDRIRVEITDPSGRRSDREVESVRSAANVIESWVREDPTALSLMPSNEAKIVAPSNVAPAPPAIVGDKPSTVPGDPVPRAVLDLDGIAGVGFDGSAWFGGGLAGCATLRRVCLGAGATIGVDPPLSGDSEALGTQRLLLDLVALLDVPIRLHSFTLRPGIDLGAAFVRMTSPAVDESGDHKHRGNEIVYSNQWAFDIGAHMTGAVSLSKRFALTVGVAVLVLPAADTDPFENENMRFAGVPRGVVRGSVGMEYGI